MAGEKPGTTKLNRKKRNIFYRKMAKKKDIEDVRNHILPVRFTKSEYDKLLSDVERYGYLSVSKYVRERLLKGRVEVKEQLVSDRDIKNQLNKLSTEISRIGGNYNKTVRKYLSTCKATRPDGSTAITTRSTNYYMNRLREDTLKIKELMEAILDSVSS